MMRRPDDIDLGLLEEVKVKDSWQKSASKILTTCWKAKGGHYFHEPVDPVKYGIDDYLDIIT